MMTEDEIKDAINTIVASKGYFTTGFIHPCEVGKVYPVAYTTPSLGKLLIIGESTRLEYEEEWRAVKGHVFPSWSVYWYRTMID